MTEEDCTQTISLRAVADDDAELLLEIYKGSRGDDLRGLGWDEDRISEFLGMQYEAQQHFYEAEYKRTADEMVLWENTPAGRLIVERREHEIRCVDLALLPEYRNQGIGTFMIRKLQNEARRESKPLRLKVIRFNLAVKHFVCIVYVRTYKTG